MTWYSAVKTCKKFQSGALQFYWWYATRLFLTMPPSLCFKVRLRAKLLARKIMGRSKPLNPLEWWVIYLITYNFILFTLNTSCTGKGVFVFFFNGNGLHDMCLKFGFGWVPTSDIVKVKLKLETIIYFAYAFLFMCMKKRMFFMISDASPPTNNPGQANGTFSNRTQSNSPQYLPVKHNRTFGNRA